MYRERNAIVIPFTRGQRILLHIASIGPLGHVPASGTVTVAVIGVPLFYGMQGWSPLLFVTTTLLFSASAICLHQIGDRWIGQKDSRVLVWDEVAGFLFAVAFVPFTWQLAITAFVLERIADIVKVPPARWIEDHWPGGWGVVGDDLVAGAYTCGVLHLLIYVWPTVMGVRP
jgi:phosphatidylglycerophosphatase A